MHGKVPLGVYAALMVDSANLRIRIHLVRLKHSFYISIYSVGSFIPALGWIFSGCVGCKNMAVGQNVVVVAPAAPSEHPKNSVEWSRCLDDVHVLVSLGWFGIHTSHYEPLIRIIHY